MMKIGDLLVQKGFVTRENFEIALAESKKTGEIIGKVLLRMGFITDEQFLNALADQLNLKYFPSLKGFKIPEDITRLVPAKYVGHYKFMPLRLKDNTLTIAVSDPLSVWHMEDLKLQLGLDIERVLVPEKEILSTIRRYYGVGSDTVEEILTQEHIDIEKEKSAGVEIQDLEKSAQDASVIKLVNQILSEAISFRATDIHLESFRGNIRARQRIDGVLYEMRVPEQIRYLYPAIISRIKILSNLNVVERRMPQDGRALIKIKDYPVDLRISIIPSLHGENAVIRILPTQILYDLNVLGFNAKDISSIELLMSKPHGIIFLTGPTGSGKTTTLYACLNRLNKEGVKIITIEDPAEYEISGIMQIQVKPEIGLTFASVLRSVLRHDPDIMMVGEVRDLDTAELSIRTALTGHLIFSTLHTNDAASGATRLVDIGIEPYLVTSSVNAFISQRLVRVICPACKEERKNKEFLPKVFKDLTLYQGKGCEKCKSIGYIGRTAIYEIVVMDEPIQEMVLSRASATQIRKRAKELGFTTLLDAGIEKIKEGITTPEEILRVAELEQG